VSSLDELVASSSNESKKEEEEGILSLDNTSMIVSMIDCEGDTPNNNISVILKNIKL